MFDRFRSFLRSVTEGNPSHSEFTRDDPRVAVAALFFEVVDADGVVSDSESQTVRTLLKEEYGLSGNELDALVKAGRMADEEAIDLYRFTSVLKRSLDSEQKVGLVELLWELVYADGERHELEDHVVWRIAELLGVSGRDRVLMRNRVAERAGIESQDDDDA